MSNSEVRSVMLYGVPIIALVMDGVERLCLAQISNTLLKTFSYNEIHNRRVALGITCIQCTPVQLELLRRAGAMPVSSRRCGMITKREAERLCKSFLAEIKPPKLPENFAFEVYHHCSWGCKGSFMPSRYNSSRAKCIKCTYCGLFFSPNKFIFHSHRLPDSKYVQPDAANFNSWRRHIKLTGDPPEDISLVWEDVKAMFNGGSRKRSMAVNLSGSVHSGGISTCSSGQTVKNSISSKSLLTYDSSHHLSKKAHIENSSNDTPPTESPHSSVDSSVCRAIPTSTLSTSSPMNSLGQNCTPLAPLTEKTHFSGLINPSQPFPTGLPPPPGLNLTGNGSNHIRGSLQTGQHIANHRASFADLMWCATASGTAKATPSWTLPYGCVFWPRTPISASDGSSPSSGVPGSYSNGTLGGCHPRLANELFNPFTVAGPKPNPPERLNNSSNHWLMPVENSVLLSSVGNRSTALIEDRMTTLSNGDSSHVSAFKPVSKFASPPIKYSDSMADEPAVPVVVQSESVESAGQSVVENGSDNDTDIDVIGNEDEDERKACLVNCKTKSDSEDPLRELNKMTWKRDSEKRSSSSSSSHPSMDCRGEMELDARSDEKAKQTLLKSLSNTPLDLSNLTSFAKGDISRIMFNGSDTRERLEKEFELMQNLMLSNGYKCSSSGPCLATPTTASMGVTSGGYNLNGDTLDDAYRGDFFKRDEIQKRFVQLFTNYVNTFRPDQHPLRN